MLARAQSYLTSFHWCQGISERYVGVGIGGVLALFLFRLKDPGEVDEWLWVVEGDLPSAYFVVDEAATPAAALSAYCELMEDWANAVSAGLPLHNVFPVRAPATLENAQMLQTRVAFMRREIIPNLP